MMKIHWNKKAVAINGDEYDLLMGKKYLKVFDKPNPARRTKREMSRRLRRSGKIIVKILIQEEVGP